jgi:hypothetical protein
MTAVAATAVLVMGACGAGGGNGVGAGDRPKLPAVASGAPARDSAAAVTAGAESMLYPVRPVTYRLAAGAKAPATSAPGYRIDRGDVDEDQTRRLATAFGLDGAVAAGEGGSFVVRDGSSQLQVDGGGVPSWHFVHDAEGSVSSDVAVACAPDGACPEPPPPPTVAGLPSPAEAEAKARALLERAGVDVDGAVVEAQQEPGRARTVVFTPTVDGRPVVGLATSVTFGERARVDYANGYLGRFEKVGDYPLVSMQDAVERLRSGFGGGGGPRALAGDLPAGAESGSGGGSSAGSTGSAGGVDAVPPAPAEPPTKEDPSGPPGSIEPPVPSEPPVTEPPEVVEITGAEVVLMLAYPTCPDDDAYLVPAFAFEPDRAGTVMAVQDESLAGGPGARDTKDVDPCPGVKPEPVPLGRPEPAPLPPEAVPTPAPAPAG